jgi:hypothetical protein
LALLPPWAGDLRRNRVGRQATPPRGYTQSSGQRCGQRPIEAVRLAAGFPPVDPAGFPPVDPAGFTPPAGGTDRDPVGAHGSSHGCTS